MLFTTYEYATFAVCAASTPSYLSFMIYRLHTFVAVTSKIGTSKNEAAQLLKAGELVAIPTETVYGLAGNGISPASVAKIFATKNRPSFDPMILHTDSLARVEHLVIDIPAPLQALADKLMPGPLTILLPRTSLVPDITTSGLPKVAIRIPSHPITLELLGLLDFPLAAPSANPFGYVSPTTAQHVLDQLGGQIPYILDGGRCSIGLESTIVDYQEGEVVVLRKGGTKVSTIESIVGAVSIQSSSTSKPSAPGMLTNHYAPKVPLRLMSVKAALTEYKPTHIGHIAWREYSTELPESNQLILSPNGTLEEAAYNLFAHLRALDQKKLHVIVTEPVDNEGLGLAINDKLRRAAAK